VLSDSRRRWTAQVRADGVLASSCGTTGSIHRLGALLQDAPSCNGWSFWHIETPEGLQPIDSLRQKHLAQLGD
nr:site-specific DNA-methyltransferase [Rhizorhabdus sp.]